MLGDNPKRSVVKNDLGVLSVKNIFKTIQGEGPHVGKVAIFIRLGGCNLACSFCDTEFEDYQDFLLSDIIKKVQYLRLNSESVPIVDLVVITGGEPFRQPIENLCIELLKSGFEVQIETNGTIYRKLPDEVDIICSPKVSNKKYLAVREEFLPRITAFKFLISTNIIGYDKIPNLGQKQHNIPVFIQAMDEQNNTINTKNKNLAVALAINYGYRLSYQIHKELGID